MKSGTFITAAVAALIALAIGWTAGKRTVSAADAARGGAAETAMARDHSHGPAAAGPGTVEKVYQCPMHPWIRSDHPGKCTICGMDLAPVGAAAAADRTLPGVVPLSASTVTVLGVRTEPAGQRRLERMLHVGGMIEDDDTRHRFLTAYSPGRVEELHVNFVGAEVHEGQPLLTLYSPELISAQREFLQIAHGGEATARAIGPARERLRGLGLSERQIDELIARGEPAQLTTLLSPATGTIVARGAYPGQNVGVGDRLFEIADFSTMWFLFQAYEQDIPWLRVGQTVHVTTKALPGKMLAAKIAFIDPNFDENTHSTQVRVELPNPLVGPEGQARREIPHRVFAEGMVEIDAPLVLAVPRSAVLDAGRGPVLYVDLGDGRYEQRSVRLGRIGDRSVEVLAGVEEGEPVVVQGNLLIDAQAQLASEAGAGIAHGHRAGEATPAGHGSASADPTMPTSSASHGSAHGSPGSQRLSAVVDAASAASGALADDNLPAYQELLPRLRNAGASLDLPPLNDVTDIAAAREAFAEWSTAVADLVRAGHEPQSVTIYQCPMAPTHKNARWLQRTGPIRNPYFGAAMLECGVEVK
jgi:Cu(I)/Ag(I) efflux system membrane fusion protein